MINNWKRKSSASSIEEVVAGNLGVKDADAEIGRWKVKYERNKYSVVGLSRACSQIRLYKSRAIHACGDYDVDGLCSISLLLHCLRRLGYSKVSYRIPRPVSEGYGLNMGMVSEIPDDTLVITVDNGIAALEEVKALRDRKMDVIVTDHHLPRTGAEGEPILPDAGIIIDPNAVEDSADFDGYCGAGIAYKLCLKLLENDEIDDPEFEHKLLTLAAVATVCDSVPLVEENYWIAKEGLRYLSQGETFPGLIALSEVFYLSGHCTETDLGFKIGPALNSDNRINDGGNTAIGLLLEDDGNKAGRYAEKLREINELRKNLVKDANALAEKIVRSFSLENDCPIFVNLGEKVRERLVGIVAGKLAETFGNPCVCFAQTTDATFKGSARSVDGVDIHDILLQAEPCYESFGGHKAACGLIVKGKENYRAMKKLTQEYVEEFGLRLEKASEKGFDLEVTADEVPEIIPVLNRLAPFGVGNPPLVFKITGFRVKPVRGRYFRTLSYDGVKFTSENGIDAVGFGFADMLDGVRPKELTLYGAITENYFRGTLTPQISFVDMEVVSFVVP